MRPSLPSASQHQAPASAARRGELDHAPRERIVERAHHRGERSGRHALREQVAREAADVAAPPRSAAAAPPRRGCAPRCGAGPGAAARTGRAPRPRRRACRRASPRRGGSRAAPWRARRRRASLPLSSVTGRGVMCADTGASSGAAAAMLASRSTVVKMPPGRPRASSTTIEPTRSACMRRIASPSVASAAQDTAARRSTLFSGASMSAPSSADSAASPRSARCERSSSSARCWVAKARQRALCPSARGSAALPAPSRRCRLRPGSGTRWAAGRPARRAGTLARPEQHVGRPPLPRTAPCLMMRSRSTTPPSGPRISSPRAW